MRGSFSIGAAHPCLAGHFAGRPVVPGVVLLDEAAAALGILPGGFGAVRFSRPVRPGDVVEVVGEGPRFEGRVAGAMVMQGSIVAR